MGGRSGKGRSMEETRDQIMHNLFGDQSDNEEEDRPDGGGSAATDPNGNAHGAGGGAHHYHSCSHLLTAVARDLTCKSSNNRRRGSRWEEGKAERQGSGALAGESEVEARHVKLNYQKMRGNMEVMHIEEEGYGQRIETSRTRDVASEFEGSEDNFHADEDRKDEEANRTRKSRPTEDDEAHEVVHDVFGDSDEEELALYGGQDDTEDVNRSPIKDEGHHGNHVEQEDIIGDKDTCYESDTNFERESKERPVGPPLNLVVPRIPPPGQPNRMAVIKVSNVVGIDPKPFNPETYVEEDAFITDESEGKKRICLKDNVVRWRKVKNVDGTESSESNARFVKWKDGSMQLLIGDEALDVSVNDSTPDTHLFMKNGKGLLLSQGRLLQTMRFMPPSLSSRSHRSLTALVDSQNKKTIKMQTWYDPKDPERVKQERERVGGAGETTTTAFATSAEAYSSVFAEEEHIRTHSILRRKREKVNHKYTQPRMGKQQVTPGFLEEALDENEAPSFKYSPRGKVAHNGFEHDLELEALAERRIINAKKVHEYPESEKEETEYETEMEDIENSATHGSESELDGKSGYDEDPQEAIGVASMPDEDIEGQEHKRNSRKRKAIDSDEESSRRKQALDHGKAVVFYSDDE